MANEIVPIVRGTVLDEEVGFTLEQLCEMCRQRAEAIITMVEEGVLDPEEGVDPATWRFPGTSVTHVRIVVRLQRDLGVNLSGAAVALDLLERLARARGRS